ncbi:hypothetical protein [Streptomyces sp. cmx-18-6]|uniref:hypothetical protein n=1 Tax=Streptomyces sp. cmx-18-6 TaxID=2790930 RepID=UPI003980C27F
MTRFVRTGAVVVAGLAASLALTACGGDSGSGKDSGPDSGTSPTPGGEKGAGESAGSGGTDAAALTGTWVGLTDGKNVTVSITAGKVALVADQAVCQGDVKDMGETMLALKCSGGNNDRSMGAIESNDGKTLVLSWGGGIKDTLSKADPGKLPTDLPSLPEMPEIPELPEMPSAS